jgi:26S proteasome non-ATPase regulatory subunit 9
MSIEEVSELIAQRDRIETEITELVNYLTGPGMPGLAESLIDEEGFPLPNLDLYRIRESRQRFNRLNNDYTDLMNKIEQGLHRLHSEAPEQEQEGPRGRVAHAEPIGVTTEREVRPFAKISEVSEASPASSAGIRPEDRVVSFGPINFTSHEELTALGRFVRENENHDVAMVVQRINAVNQMEVVSLTVRPQQWHGQGLLGCRFLPDS